MPNSGETGNIQADFVNPWFALPLATTVTATQFGDSYILVSDRAVKMYWLSAEHPGIPLSPGSDFHYF
jgi:hypothetical protein